MSRVAGIVLAAGLSERMGRPKQLLPYRDGILLDAAVAAAEGSRLDPVVVVVGAAAVEVEATLRRTRARVVRNLRYRDGNMTSLRVGVGAVGDHDAVVVVPGDMPEITAEILDRVVSAWEADPRPLAVAVYEDGEAHPLLVAASVTARLDDIDGPKAMWRLLEDAPQADVLRVPIAARRPRDVDTPEDYDALGHRGPGQDP